ncbi:MAG: hypothetical protein M3N46_05650 [Actinomycetota bacterium]|nr:hypothetical protein [Actinomycetota bacterium]
MTESERPRVATVARGLRWQTLIAEVVALLLILALVFAKLAAVSGSSWRTVFLANGDSLVLPLLLQSLERGEPSDWVFSSQTFFFPEFPLYALCGLIMGTAQGGLVLNAALNVVLLYLGFRAITAAFAPRKRIRQLLVSLSAVLAFLVVVLCESGVRVLGVGTVEPSRIATLFLMTTYYGGALLISLGMLALVYWGSTRFRGGVVDRRRILVYGLVVVLVSGAITYSNPLYLLWFVAPFCATLLLLLILRRITLRWALILVFPHILGIGAGMLARGVFARYIAANIDAYLSTFGASQAASLLLSVVRGWLESPLGILQLLILVLPFALVVVFLIRHSRHGGVGDPPRATTSELFIAVFILIAGISLIAVQVGAGRSVTRYLLPLFVFPLLALLLVRGEKMERLLHSVQTRLRIVLAVTLSSAAILTIGLSAPAVADLASPRSPVDTACLSNWLSTKPDGGRNVNGVGSFWTVRALALYGDQKGRLVQVILPLSIHAWMNNLSLYEGATFSYAVADQVITGSSLREVLGKPGSIVRCDGFSIYDYAGTRGQTSLNDDIQRSEEILKLSRH